MKQNPLEFTTDDFDYDLPNELIALQPAPNRDSSRLLIVSKCEDQFVDKCFADIQDYLQSGDLLVLNDTKVFPARLFANKQSGGKVEILAERILDDGLVKAQLKSNRTPKEGSLLNIDEDISIQVCRRDEEFFILEILSELPSIEIFQRYGHMPLPPYIEREDTDNDKSRYQTVYANKLGAVAAPTAGLHFTQVLLDNLKQQQIDTATITLHVGAGTFKPVKVEDPSQHQMHSEFAHVPQSVCDKIQQTKNNGGRVIAVGTTCVRALESAALNGVLKAFTGDTDIFIYPGFEFKVVDALITNFHLPRSTLLMLISALAGHEKIQSAYQHAINKRYRFYSYGDAMFITS
ncbi:MAG: tRNA preQ1(34) S-adenosylmethionine ribosyltransferase-isomerase QueA [Gammaproteobacteria bacterium]|nr:tRNA preQ1(34) S-adenosylmethionine ribosyltransferase-isomerase QueA [Gammaproteobacteria bacterium]